MHRRECGELCPDAPRSGFFAVGAGASVLWIDPALDLVVVLRWIDQARLNEICAGFIASLNDGGARTAPTPDGTGQV